MIVIMFGFMFASITPFIGQPSSTSTASSFILQFILLIVVIVVIALVLGMISGFLYMRAFNKLSDKSGVDGFKTAGILYLVGVIVPIVGWIAWIFAYMGFNKFTPIPNYTHTTPPTIPNTGLAKRCPTAELKTLRTHCSAKTAANHYN